MKHEIICITRAGFNFLHGQGVDLAAKVTYQRYQPNADGSSGGTFDPREDVLQELFIPRAPQE